MEVDAKPEVVVKVEPDQAPSNNNNNDTAPPADKSAESADAPKGKESEESKESKESEESKEAPDEFGRVPVCLHGEWIHVTPGSLAHTLAVSKGGSVSEEVRPAPGTEGARAEDEVTERFGGLVRSILERGDNVTLTSQEAMDVGRLFDELRRAHARAEALAKLNERLAWENKDIGNFTRHLTLQHEKEQRLSKSFEFKYHKLLRKDRKGGLKDVYLPSDDEFSDGSGAEDHAPLPPGLRKLCAHCGATETPRWVLGHVGYHGSLVCNSCDVWYRERGAYPTTEQISLLSAQRGGAGGSQPAAGKPSGHRGAMAASNGGGSGRPSSTGSKRNGSKAKKEINWVQCDECKKWRSLKDGINPDDLPQIWYCHMNTWDPNFAKCAAPQEEADSGDNDDDDDDTTASQGGSKRGGAASGARAKKKARTEGDRICAHCDTVAADLRSGKGPYDGRNVCRNCGVYFDRHKEYPSAELIRKRKKNSSAQKAKDDEDKKKKNA